MREKEPRFASEKWVIKPYRHHLNSNSFCIRYTHTICIENGMRDICKVTSGGSANDNLNLISQAPEMYRLLQAFVKWDKDYPVGYNPMKGLCEFNDLISEAKKLIDKARGEQ